MGSLCGVKSYSKWSKLLRKGVNFTPLRVKFYSFYRAIPLFTPYGVIIFYSGRGLKLERGTMEDGKRNRIVG